MATLATGLLARFGRAGFAPAGFHQEVSPFHLRFLPFHAFPSAITMSALSSPFLRFFEISCRFFSFFERNTPSTPKSGLRWFLCWPSRGDQGSLVIFQSASIR